MSKLTMEKMFEVWNDGWHFEIGADRDGLGMLEIRYYEGFDTEVLNHMCFTKEEGALFAKAILELVGE